MCHDFGFGDAFESSLTGSDNFTVTTKGIFLLGNIDCAEEDKYYGRSLMDCFHGQWANTGCVPGQEASVRCHPPGQLYFS